MSRRAIAISFAAACALCGLVAVAFTTLFPEPPAAALWGLTVLVTLLVSRYQRRTGPGYEVPATSTIGGARVSAKLPTSFARETDCPVRLRLEDRTSASGVSALECPAPSLVFRRYPTSEGWTSVPFSRAEDGMVALIPRQPHAGKVEYHIELGDGTGRVTLPAGDNVIVRFRGSVGAGALLPHVVLMLAGMVLSIRTGLETWYGGSQQELYTALTLAALVGGGMVFGPLVQKAAFGKYWTGVPFGTDLTDNKTLIAVLAWGVALGASVAGWEQAPALRLGASALTLVAFLIPHSLFGSELRYEQ